MWLSLSQILNTQTVAVIYVVVTVQQPQKTILFLSMLLMMILESFLVPFVENLLYEHNFMASSQPPVFVCGYQSIIK